MRAAIYARVSTFDQEPENQLQELRRYTEVEAGLRLSLWIAVSVVRRIVGLRSIR